MKVNIYDTNTNTIVETITSRARKHNSIVDDVMAAIEKKDNCRSLVTGKIDYLNSCRIPYCLLGSAMFITTGQNRVYQFEVIK